jgi:hypothetical protein
MEWNERPGFSNPTLLSNCKKIYECVHTSCKRGRECGTYLRRKLHGAFFSYQIPNKHFSAETTGD